MDATSNHGDNSNIILDDDIESDSLEDATTAAISGDVAAAQNAAAALQVRLGADDDAGMPRTHRAWMQSQSQSQAAMRENAPGLITARRRIPVDHHTSAFTSEQIQQARLRRQARNSSAAAAAVVVVAAPRDDDEYEDDDEVVQRQQQQLMGGLHNNNNNNNIGAAGGGGMRINNVNANNASSNINNNHNLLPGTMMTRLPFDYSLL